MKKTLIIAEAGVNHNGNILLAHKLIDAAVDSGADIIKFQTFTSSLLTTSFAEKTKYQINNTPANESQREMLSKLELGLDDHKELIKHCEMRGIEFLSTAFDDNSIELLKKLKLKRIKIPSGEITNIPYIRKMCDLNKPVILSTGMSNLEEIAVALKEIKRSGIKDENITVLHCSTEYPALIRNVNLNAINTIRSCFNTKVGYSDHTDGIEIAIAATAIGSTLIEKHITVDRNLDGPDHFASIEPPLFKRMVDGIRNVDLALGDGNKIPSSIEIENSKIVRKSIVAAKKIKKGEIFTIDNLVVKRPGTGISPLHWDKILGKISKYDFEEDELIK